MDATEIVGAEYWATFWEWVADKAFIVVVVALAIEYITGRWAKPHREVLENARKLQVAQLTKDAARLATEGDQARAAIAEANARQKEAELRLEQLRKQMGPRRLNADVFVKALEGKPKAPVEIMFPKEDGEAYSLALQFRDTLHRAGWTASEPLQVPPNSIERLKDQPSHIAAGGEAMGVAVAVRADTQSDFDQIGPGKNTPAQAIFEAISAAFGGAAAYTAGPEIFNAPAPGVVRIVVGTKP